MPERTDLSMLDTEDIGGGLDNGRKMDIKVLQKSNTFSSLSTGSQKLGSWFDRRARKLSMKCSKSITLGKVTFPDKLSVEKLSKMFKKCYDKSRIPGVVWGRFRK